MQTYDNISDMSSEEFYLDVAVTNLSKSEIDPQLGVLSCDIEFTCLSPWYKLFPDLKLTTLYATENGTYTAPLGFDGYGAVIADVDSDRPVDITNGVSYSAREINAFQDWFDAPIETLPETQCNYLLSNYHVFNNTIKMSYGINNTAYMLANCVKFNQPINIPETVTNTSHMFYQCFNFNQPIIIPETVTDTSSMFHSCNRYNLPTSIPSNVINAYEMFSGCTSFNQPVVIPDGVTDIDYMFYSCFKFNQPIVIPNSVLNAAYLLCRCFNYNQPIYVPDSCLNWYRIIADEYDYNSLTSLPNNKWGFPDAGHGYPGPNNSGRRVIFRDTGEIYMPSNTGWVLVQ